MNKTFIRASARGVAACALGLIASLAGAQGLTERPLNLTCVAPDRPTVSFELQPVAQRFPATSGSAMGAEGGVLYRGRGAPGLQGLYLFADAQTNELIARAYVADHQYADQVALTPKVQMLGLAESPDGELLIETSAGVMQLMRGPEAAAGGFPATLSATGCFDVNDVSVAAQGLIPYAPSATLWSDGALKRRWIAMPDWLVADSTITVLPDGDFDFPIGTVLVKEFALGTFIVETRLLVRHNDGGWAGYSYEWNDEQTDAVLLAGFKERDVMGQLWTYPSRGQCLACHTDAANRSLGPEIAQLNSDLDYGTAGVGNQLATLDAIGLIEGGLSGPVATLDALPAYADDTAPLSDRARGYLHANCSMCHRPGGPGIGPEDFRYALAGSQIGALDVDPTRGNLGVPGAKLLKRGLPEESVLWLRLGSESFQRMPPLGVSIVDQQGLGLVGDWIRSGSGFAFVDTDGDEFSDDLDNCSALANADQRDTDGDGFGNACDADLNNDGIINVIDLGLLRLRFFSTDADADFNGDGVVNVIDLGRLKDQFFGAPGPGAVTL